MQYNAGHATSQALFSKPSLTRALRGSTWPVVAMSGGAGSNSGNGPIAPHFSFADHGSGGDAGMHKKHNVSHLQRLFDSFRHSVLAHSGAEQIPSSEVQALKLLMGAVPLEELGVRPPPVQQDGKPVDDVLQRLRVLHGSQQTRPPIKYLHVYEDSHVSVGVFCLPANASIPLHNHPGMTVLSRVLYGQMFVQSFDWCEPDRPAEADDGSPARRAAKLVVSKVQTPDEEPLVLFPRDGGNIHAFTALTDCAVLDVLSPPYDSTHDRDCTYYYLAARDPKQRGVVTLEEYEPPEDFIVTRGVYRGMRIAANSSSGLSDDFMYNI